MKIDILFGGDVVVLPGRAVMENLPRASELDIRVLLNLMSEPGIRRDYERHRPGLAKRLRCAETDIDAAVAFWRGAGAIDCQSGGEKAEAAETRKTETVKSEAVRAEAEKAAGEKKPCRRIESPVYTGEELERLTGENGSLRRLIDECQKIAGKMLNPLEISKIAGLSDFLKLDNEYILTLFTYCKNKGKSSVHYLEKTAYNLYDDGIGTTEELEAHIKQREEYDNAAAKLRRLCGIGGRAFTKKENGCINAWFNEWKLDFALIERAYEITVNNTAGNTFSMPYMHTVLSNWHDAGYKTVSEVDAALTKHKEEKTGGSSYDLDEFFELALARSYENV